MVGDVRRQVYVFGMQVLRFWQASFTSLNCIERSCSPHIFGLTATFDLVCLATYSAAGGRALRSTTDPPAFEATSEVLAVDALDFPLSLYFVLP